MRTIPRSAYRGALHALLMLLILSCSPKSLPANQRTASNAASAEAMPSEKPSAVTTGTTATGNTAGPTTTPSGIATQGTPTVQPASRGATSALQLLVVATPHLGAPAYDRDQWPLWTDEDHDCQDTRQEVLIAESRGAVTFVTGSMCRVAAGVWFDEYTGVSTTNPGDFDIDHLVPLANAHISGGWAWSVTQRRAYANDLTNAEQLIAVSASANRSKGSQAPDTWKPPRHEYWCEYASSWITVKVRWTLTVTESERNALSAMLTTCPSEGTPAPQGAPTTPTAVTIPLIPTAPTPTATPASGPAASVTPQACDPSYPDVCIPPFPPDLNCGDIPFRRFRVVGPDPHRFDGNRDGVGCES